jgi:hypothetical protein
VAFEVPIIVEAVSGDTAITFSARQLRTIADAVWAQEGVVATTDLLPSQRAAGANMSVDLSAGMVIIQGNSIANQGKYVCRSTAVTNLPINPAPGSGTRTDLIVAQLSDKQADGGTTYQWAPIVLSGTTTVPPSAAEIGRVNVPAGTASIVAGNLDVSNRQYATMNRLVAPSQTAQASEPNYATVGSFVDFTSGQWPALTFVFPPSGTVFITISADCQNTNTSTSTAWATWRLSSGSASWQNMGQPGLGTGVSTSGSRTYASRRTMVSGTPRDAVTLTPQWNISSGNSSTAQIVNGTLSVEYVR